MTKEERAEYNKLYYAKNKKKLLTRKKITNKVYRERNKETIALKSAKYYQENKDRFYKSKKLWREANRAKVTAQRAKYRASKQNATPSWLTKEQLKEIECYYKEARRLTEESGTLHQVDHIHPLSGKDVCGLHVPWNLQVLTATENIKKYNKLGDI